MKATDTQKNVCNSLIRTICFWRDSNDITSPTHLSENLPELDINTATNK